jgi:hypothetical protein
VVRVQVIFWVVMPCSDVVGYWCFRGPYCLHLQGEVNGDGKKGHIYRLGNHCNATQGHNPQDLNLDI